MDVGDGIAERGVALDDGAGDFDGFVGGVVEDLYVEAVERVLHLANGIDEAVDDELLVEDRKLDGHAREFVEARRGLGDLVLAIAVVHPHELVTVEAVGGKDNENDEVGNQEHQVETVDLVEALECFVEEMSAEVVAESARRGCHRQGRYECGDQMIYSRKRSARRDAVQTFDCTR
jgi:hypothetical protein